MRRLVVRALWGVLALVLVIVAGIGAMFGITFMGNADLRDGEKLSSFAHIVKDGFVSIAVLDLGNGKVALIDAGNDPKAQALMSALARMKKKPTDVEAVFLTHGHQDHLQGLYALPGARVYGLAQEAALVGGRRSNRGPLTRHFKPQRTGLEISHPLRDGESIRLGNRTLRVLAVPGHTRGSAAYYVEGLIFLGDSADANDEGELTPAKWLFSDDPEQNRASLRALEARLMRENLPVKRMAFAHTASLPGISALSAFNRKH